MGTCPNCGEIVMNGDPYCSHCGTALRWVGEDRNSESRQSGVHIRDLPIQSFYSTFDARFGGHCIDTIERYIDVSKVRNATVNIIRQSPFDDIKIDFMRKNRYFTTTDSLLYSPFSKKISGYRFDTDFGTLERTEWFIKAIKQKEKETNQKFYSCGGGYDAHWDWQNNKFELKDGCSVVAHFHEDRYFTRGYEVDFRNRRLKTNSERFERATPYDLTSDYDYLSY